MRTRLGFLLLTLVALGSVIGRAQTFETFELRTDAPMVGRSVNITDASGTWNAGAFALTQGAAGSAGACRAIVGGVSLEVENPEAGWTLEAGGMVATLDAATVEAARSNGYVLWLSFASTGGGRRCASFSSRMNARATRSASLSRAARVDAPSSRRSMPMNR